MLLAATLPAQARDVAGLQPEAEVVSRFVPGRMVQVWLPPDYGKGSRRYPVIYLHDGQNVFDEPAPLSGHSWHVERALALGIAEHRMRPAILVAVWNTANRLGEYMPEAALPGGNEGVALAPGVTLPRGQVAGDAYLRFLVEELKPRIDRRYRTLADPRNTLLMGSSMGGLISAYAVARYPKTFGGAACLSTSWPIAGGFAVDWFAAHLPDTASHRFYFDHGTGTADGEIGPDQSRVDAALAGAGYGPASLLSLRWPGYRHTEAAWAERVYAPLEFLLGPIR